ncbi:MAG: NUDIX hydrolase [Candidatus Omnitrophica bacterium]|nr:NUDIX hydrolase [Candidatus Omnitrophota bacterium]
MKDIYNKKSKKVILHKGKYLNFVRRGKWEYVERVNCSGAVIILALTPQKKVLFVEQFRPAVQKNVVEFPAGLVNDTRKKGRESLLAAAKRELLEETGYLASNMIELMDGPVSSGICSDMMSVVLATGLKRIGDGGGDEWESIKVHEVPFSKVEEWLRMKREKGSLVGTRIYAGLYLLNKYNEIST